MNIQEQEKLHSLFNQGYRLSILDGFKNEFEAGFVIDILIDTALSREGYVYDSIHCVGRPLKDLELDSVKIYQEISITELNKTS